MTQKGGANAYSSPKYTGISIQTSAQGVAIPYIAGKVRAGTNLIWYGDFKKVAVKRGGSGGGKGTQLYKYSAAVMLGLCEGQIQSIDQVWVDQATSTLAALGLTLFTGSASQSPWSYMVSKHPSEALSYAYTAYLANESYQLGNVPTLPNHNFEIVSLFSGTMPGTVDVNFADVIPDFLNNPQYGLVSTNIDSTSLAFYKTYCQAQGLWFSVLRDKAEQVSQTLDRWATLTNTWIGWSGSSLKFIPLGDTAITANGVTYTPNTTVQYALTEDDFFPGNGPPIITERSDPADRPNHVKLQVKDRVNAYNVASVEWQDQGLVDQFGRVDNSVTDASEICDLTVGNLVAQFIGQRGAYIPNTYSFKLGYELGSGLEFGDICTIQSGKSGIPNPISVRIRTLDEDNAGAWSILAEGIVQGTGTVVPGNQPSSDGGFIDTQVDPGDVNFPMIFEPTSDLTAGIPQLWLAASGGPDWGGAVVYVSFDDITYTPMGAITSPALQGHITTTLGPHSDPDPSGAFTADLTLSDGIMDTTATHADADAFRTLVLITNNIPGFIIPRNGEMISYGSVAPGSGSFLFNISYLRRGLYGTTIANHPVGSNFCRFDLNAVEGLGNSVFTYLIPSQYIGTTIYFKLASFNSFGNAAQDISLLSSYSYVSSGVGYGPVNGLPAQPTGFAGSPSANGALFSWTANAVNDNVETYQIWGALGTGTAFGSTSLMYTTNSLNCLVPNLTANTAYTFYLVAVNSVGSSTPSALQNVTTGAAPITGSSYRAVTYSTSPVTLLNSDAYVDITNTFGPNLVVKMPPAPTSGQRIVLMDAGGNAGTNTILLKNNAGSTQLDQIIVNSGWTNPEMWNGSTWRQTA